MVDRNIDAEIQQDMMEILKKWQDEIGAPPGAVMQFDLFMEDCMLHGLVQYLDDKGIIEDRHEFDNFIARWMIRRMQEEFEPAKKAKQEHMRRLLTDGLPAMTMPKGKMN